MGPRAYRGEPLPNEGRGCGVCSRESALDGFCVEEVLFRGVAFHRAQRWVSPVTAALGSSLLFGVIHTDIVGATTRGLLLMGLYIRTGSFWVCFLAHALVNASAALVLALIEARASLHWALLGVQLFCVPWFFWFVWSRLRRLCAPV